MLCRRDLADVTSADSLKEHHQKWQKSMLCTSDQNPGGYWVDSPNASLIAGITVMHHHVWLMGFTLGMGKQGKFYFCKRIQLINFLNIRKYRKQNTTQRQH